MFPEPSPRSWQGELCSAKVQADWQAVVDGFLHSDAGRALGHFLQSRLQERAVIYPPRPLRALELTARSEVRVLILGQDPYHGALQADGLAFSVPQGIRIAPSLRNIFKERQRDLGLPAPAHGCLDGWARQGVLLLNTTLTVEEGRPGSHAKRGWEHLSGAIIRACAMQDSSVVFLLWGAHAQAQRELIAAHNANQRHLILCANHPSPLAALRPPHPFIGCGHFSATRRWLQERGVAASDLFC